MNRRSSCVAKHLVISLLLCGLAGMLGCGHSRAVRAPRQASETQAPSGPPGALGMRDIGPRNPDPGALVVVEPSELPARQSERGSRASAAR